MIFEELQTNNSCICDTTFHLLLKLQSRCSHILCTTLDIFTKKKSKLKFFTYYLHSSLYQQYFLTDVRNIIGFGCLIQTNLNTDKHTISNLYMYSIFYIFDVCFLSIKMQQLWHSVSIIPRIEIVQYLYFSFCLRSFSLKQSIWWLTTKTV